MYRELLLTHGAGISWLDVQDPAEIAEIRRAEAAIGLPFPEELTALLLELNGDGWLFFSTARMEEVHNAVHKNLAEVYPGVEKLLFFAGNGCGDYYCCRPGEAGIFRWEHETGDCVPVARDIPELIVRYFADEI